MFFYERNYNFFKSNTPDFYQIDNTKLQYSIKVYPPNHIQGLLNSWFKQTLETPDVSLLSEKKGTLILPCIEEAVICLYPEFVRQKLLDHLNKKISSIWPSIAEWNSTWGSFKNKSGVLGTPMFDSVFFGEKSMLVRAIKDIKKNHKMCEIVDTYQEAIETEVQDSKVYIKFL